MAHGCDTFHLASSGVVVNTFSSIPATDRNPLWDCIRKGVWCKTLLNQRNDNKSAVLGDVCDFLHLFFLFWGVKVSNGLEWTDSETDSGKKRTAHLEIIEAASWLTWASFVYCSVKSSFSLWSSEIRLKVVPPPSPSFTQPSYCLHMPLPLLHLCYVVSEAQHQLQSLSPSTVCTAHSNCLHCLMKERDLSEHISSLRGAGFRLLRRFLEYK